MTGFRAGVVSAGRADLTASPSDTMLTGEVPDRVAWLSGRSSALHGALAPEQARLLDVAADHGFEPVPTGFPFVAGPSWRRAGIGSASLRNGRQYLALRRDPGTAASVAARLQPLFEATSSRLLLVCGSLGLELLRAGLRAMHRPATPAVRVVALGPVAGHVPDGLDVWAVQGRLDPISLLGYRGPVRSRPWCGHLGYAGRAEVAEVVAAACGSPW